MGFFHLFAKTFTEEMGILEIATENLPVEDESEVEQFKADFIDKIGSLFFDIPRRTAESSPDSFRLRVTLPHGAGEVRFKFGRAAMVTVLQYLAQAQACIAANDGTDRLEYTTIRTGGVDGIPLLKTAFLFLSACRSV